jgi:hypothetical protein
MKAKEDSVHKAVEEGNIQAIITKMAAGRIVEVTHEDDRYHAMAHHYGKLNDNERKQSWLVAHSKQSVHHLNLLAHQSLLTQGKLGKSVAINVLIPHFLPEGKGALAASYQKDQVVRFNESYSTLKVDRGEYLRVVKHSKISNRVVLQKENDSHVVWQPDKIAGATLGKVELFNKVQREFAVNETMIVNRSLRSKGIVKGERVTITAINPRNITLKNSEGRMVMLDLSKPYHRHIDYGYAATLHAIAHEKPEFLIADLPSRAFYTDQRRFYQAVSQPKEAWIYTDNYQGLVAHLEKKTGDRLTAHATVSQSQELKKNLHSLHDILEKQFPQNGNASVLSRYSVDAIEYAMHHLAEREAGFTHKQLMQTAMQHAVGKVTASTLAKATVAMEKAGILIRGSRDDGTLWTTLEAVKMEREIIALCHQDKEKLEPIASDGLLEKYCDPAKLKPEQIAAVKAITQSKDRVMAVQGHPGTGKTTMLATVADVLIAKNLLAGEGYELLGLAPTHTAVKELTERGIPAQTLDSFIMSTKRELADTKQVIQQDKLILVIDEASMVSNKKMVEVLQIAHQLACRGVIPTGDTRQLPAIESGKPFELMQREVNTQTLVDIRRQSDDALLLKQAVKETVLYDFKAAFQTLKDSIIEVPIFSNKNPELPKEEIRAANRLERVSLLVKDYFSFAKKDRDNIQVITPGHDDRKLANTLIREGLKAEGSVTKDNDQSFTILTSKSLTHVERSHLTHLQEGDVLRFGQRESVHIKAGDYFTIRSISANHRLLTLAGDNGREVTWQVPTFDKKRLSSIEVFQQESRHLQVSDVIRWSRSDKKNGLLSTEAAKITALEKNKMTVELANKQSFTFDPRHAQFQHWDHGYAATVYAVQGKTKEIILAHLESFRENLTNQPSFLVALTRAVNVFRLYTDNIERLLKAIERNTGVKLSSLEVIGELPEKMLKKAQEKKAKTTLAKVIPTTLKKEKARENRYPFDRHTIDPFSNYENRRMKLANKIAKESVPLKGTLAEKYLKEYRGIELDQMPENIRFHPHVYSSQNQKALPALIAIARNKEGKIQSVEAIYLDAKTADKADVPLQKQTIGPKKGAMVMLKQTHDSSTPTLIAEGVVTGLSLVKALPNVNVSITLGKQMFTSIEPSLLSQKTIFCLDNDGRNLKTDRTILEAANRLSDHKKEVSFMLPTGLDMKKQDYNDILKQRGIAAIRHDFQHAISYDDFYKNKAHTLNIKPERMAQLSKEIIKDVYQKDKDYLHAYQTMDRNNQPVTSDKTLSIIKEFEREI